MADEQQDTVLENGQASSAEETHEAASDETQAAYQELNNRYMRLAADFDNYRKRQAQERESLYKYGAQTTMESLLPVLDNLQRAQQSLNENSDPKMLYKSFEMMSQQLLDALGSIGLQRIHPEGEPFDLEKHEAISQVENADVPEHTIFQVYQDGYLLHDRVLRPAKVVVSCQPATCNTPEGGTFEPAMAESKKKNPFQQ